MEGFSLLHIKSELKVFWAMKMRRQQQKWLWLMMVDDIERGRADEFGLNMHIYPMP